MVKRCYNLGTCYDCFYWKALSSVVGACHALPPQSIKKRDCGGYYGQWPLTTDRDFCGSYKKAEND